MERKGGTDERVDRKFYYFLWSCDSYVCMCVCVFLSPFRPDRYGSAGKTKSIILLSIMQQ